MSLERLRKEAEANPGCQVARHALYRELVRREVPDNPYVEMFSYSTVSGRHVAWYDKWVSKEALVFVNTVCQRGALVCRSEILKLDDYRGRGLGGWLLYEVAWQLCKHWVDGSALSAGDLRGLQGFHAFARECGIALRNDLMRARAKGALWNPYNGGMVPDLWIPIWIRTDSPVMSISHPLVELTFDDRWVAQMEGDSRLKRCQILPSLLIAEALSV